MNKKISLILLILILVIPISLYANNEVDYIRYSISNNNLITQFTNKDQPNEIKNKIRIESVISRNNNLKLEKFDKSDKLTKELISEISKSIKNQELPYFTVSNGARIKTLEENLFITADYLDYSNNSFSHKNAYLFMDGKVVLKSIDKKNNIILDTKEIDTLEEFKMIESNSLNEDYWNLKEYKKGGQILLSENGYYLISVRDNLKNILDTMIVKVIDESNIKNISFLDVSKNSWYYNDVVKATNTGIIVGRDDGNFDPQGKLTIAEAITLSARARARYEDEELYEGGFRWFDNAVDYAVKNNIVKIGDFIDYNKFATREEMAYIFANTMPDNYYKKQDVKLPKDIDKSRYKEYIISLYKANILEGRDDGNFDPKSYITRAESAVIINRLINK